MISRRNFLRSAALTATGTVLLPWGELWKPKVMVTVPAYEGVGGPISRWVLLVDSAGNRVIDTEGRQISVWAPVWSEPGARNTGEAYFGTFIDFNAETFFDTSLRRS